MTACRWDPDAADYLVDGEPCRHDDYGDPTRHCTARRTCSQHIGWGELTCARCLGRCRMNLRQIVQLTPLMMYEALDLGVADTEAVNLAGPATDPEAWTWRKVAAKAGTSWHWSILEEDDEEHPETVLTRWAQILTEDYRLTRPDRWDLSNAAGFLDRILARLAQDDGQDFPHFAREIRKVRSHLETVLSNSQTPERGAPCPDCANRLQPRFVRLVRWYPHWCDDEDCEQFHYDTDEADRWVCPADKAHSWDLASYSHYVEERKAVAG